MNTHLIRLFFVFLGCMPWLSASEGEAPSCKRPKVAKKSVRFADTVAAEQAQKLVDGCLKKMVTDEEIGAEVCRIIASIDAQYASPEAFDCGDDVVVADITKAQLAADHFQRKLKKLDDEFMSAEQLTQDYADRVHLLGTVSLKWAFFAQQLALGTDEWRELLQEYHDLIMQQRDLITAYRKRMRAQATVVVRPIPVRSRRCEEVDTLIALARDADDVQTLEVVRTVVDQLFAQPKYHDNRELIQLKADIEHRLNSF